jgi:hypothetical protein
MGANVDISTRRGHGNVNGSGPRRYYDVLFLAPTQIHNTKFKRKANHINLSHGYSLYFTKTFSP